MPGANQGDEIEGEPEIEPVLNVPEPVIIQIDPIQVNPNRWNGLSKNSTNIMQHIFELTDNSIAQHVAGVPLRVDIILEQDPPEQGVKYTNKIIVKDNAKGIADDILAEALMPDALAGHWGEDIGSEHGYGMKPAIASLSESPKIITKPIESDKGYVLETQQIINLVNGQGSEITLNDIDELGEHGTIIELSDLTTGKGRNVGMMKTGTNPIKVLIARLGQRYREVLKTAYGIFDGSDDSGIFVTIIQSDDTSACTKVIGYSPIYFQCPITSTYGVPVEDRTWQLTGEDPVWSAKLRIGKAPNKPHHYDHITSGKPGKFHPYKVSGKNAGFDIIHRDIVITTGWIPEQEVMPEIDDHGSTNNLIRGEIILENGFQSTRIKDRPDANEAWFQLLEKLKDKLFNYTSDLVEEPIILYDKLAWRSKKEPKYTESQYVNQLKHKLSNLCESKGQIHGTFPRVESFTRDHEQPTAFGKPDITINVNTKNEIMVEAKQISAEGKHIYQLRAYMDANDCNYGILLSPGVSDTGQAALDYLRTIKKGIIGFRKMRYNIEHISTDEISQFPIDFE